MATVALAKGNGLSFGKRFQQSGLAAGRPVSGLAPDGMFLEYYSTDTQVLNVWDGTQWVQFSQSGGGGSVPVGSLRSVDNDNVPSGHLLLNGDEITPGDYPDVPAALFPTVTNARYGHPIFNILDSGVLVGGGNLLDEAPPICVTFTSSSDSGANWTPRNKFYTPNSGTLPITGVSYPIASAVNGANIIFCGQGDDLAYNTGALWISNDSGVTFREIGFEKFEKMLLRSSTICNDITFGNNYWVIATYEGVYISNDNGVTWSFQEIAEELTFFTIAHDDVNNVFAIIGVSEGGSQLAMTASDSDPYTWNEITVGNPSLFSQLIFDGSQLIGLDYSDNSFYISTDGGATWNAIVTDFLPSIFTNDSSHSLYIGINGADVKTSSDLATWTTRYTATGGDTLERLNSLNGETYVGINGTTEYKMLHSSDGLSYAITGNLPRVTASFTRVVREGALDIYSAMKVE